MARIYALLAVMLWLPTSSAAGTLAPRKASDIVALSTSSATTGCSAVEYRVDLRSLPDGTNEAFVVPEKRVLVVTSIDFYSSAGTSGKRYRYALRTDAGTLAVADAGVASADGHLAGSMVIPSGVVVAPGTPLCSLLQDGTGTNIPAFARIHGFFAKDK